MNIKKRVKRLLRQFSEPCEYKAVVCNVPIFAQPSWTSAKIGTIKKGERVSSRTFFRDWAQFTSPSGETGFFHPSLLVRTNLCRIPELDFFSDGHLVIVYDRGTHVPCGRGYENHFTVHNVGSSSYCGKITLRLFDKHKQIYQHTDEYEVETLAEPSGPLFKAITSVKPTHYEFTYMDTVIDTGDTAGRIGIVIRPGETPEPDYDREITLSDFLK